MDSGITVAFVTLANDAKLDLTLIFGPLGPSGVIPMTSLFFSLEIIDFVELIFFFEDDPTIVLI